MSKYLLAGIFCLSLLVGLVVPVAAQTPTATPVPLTPAAPAGQVLTTTLQTTPTATLAPGVNAPITSADAFTFLQLNQDEILLTGPYDTHNFLFGLPADWKPIGGSALNLFLTVAFNTSVQGTGEYNVVNGGVMQVRLNGVSLGVLQLNRIGEINERLEIPERALISRRQDGRMELTFILDSSLTCTLNQQMNVIIYPSSQVLLPHEITTPSTDLVRFPYPLYQDSIYPDTALIVVPDDPAAAELQAAMTLAAGLGNLTNNALTMTLTTAGQLTAEQKATQHLILVGKSGSLPMLNELALPLPPKIEAGGGQFSLDGGGPDDGVIQMVNSTANSGKVVLVVSGNTDAAVIKAAQAITTGLLRPNRSPNLAIVDQVSPTPIPVSQPLDQTLGDMGYEVNSLERLGINTASYQFYLPPGQTLASDAVFDLVYGHSALLDYDRSGLVVLLNNQPIGSVRFNDDTAKQANNHMQIPLPASAGLPGQNRLDLRVTLALRDNCIGPDINGQFFTIWPESRLHLPLNPSQATAELTYDMSVYPMPFILNSTLSSTALVLQRNDLPTWQTALGIARFLGDRANGPVTALNVFYGDEVPEDALPEYNLLIIGRPSQLPIMTALNESLPAPFEAGSEVAREASMQVTYRIPNDSPVGYVQMLPSPWNNQNLVMVAVGNTAESVQWAASALVNASLRSQLAGNFAVINNEQIITGDTRVSMPRIEAVATNAPNVMAVVQPQMNLNVPPQARPTWILPAIVVAAALSGLVLILAVLGAFARQRRNRAS